ncbi:hypothetical protein ACS0TY_017376 [Phlomoides rotata]
MKMKRLKLVLKQWSRNTFGSLHNLIENQKENIERLDKFDDVFGIEDEEIIERNRITAELRRNLIWKESFLFQKAKAKWIKEGDVNSSFFHDWINKRVKLNGIDGLLVNNAWVDSKEGIRKEQQGRDTWRWTRAGNGKFSTKEAYRILARAASVPNAEVWYAVYNWTGSVMVPHCVPCLHLLQHSSFLGNSSSEDVAVSIWVATVGTIWMMRNLAVFEEVKPSLSKASGEIKAITWSWLKAKSSIVHNFSFSEWCRNPRMVVM